MTPKDLAVLHARVFTVPRPFTEAEFANFLDAPSTILETARDGFALGRIIAGEVELLTIAVAPCCRRQGVGRALLTRFHRAASLRDGTEVFLDVDAENRAARALYARFQYIETGRRPKYYRHPDGHRSDALLLRRPLSANDRLQIKNRQ